MGAPVATDNEGILGAIRDWPAEKRLDLIRDIPRTIKPRELLYEASEVGAQPRRKHTLEKALGLLATDHRAPSDAEVEEWLEQRRSEKYG